MTDSDLDGDSEVHPDDGAGINRQVVLGGIVVALTLAVAAWLAYGVVQRSSSSPRVAGLVPDSSRGTAQGGVTSSTGRGHATTTTKAAKAAKGATTTRPRRDSTATSATDGNGTTQGGGGHGVTFAAKWSAYSKAWIDECRSIWKHATNGKLYDRDDPGSVYTVEDCTRTLDSIFMTANVTSVAKAKTEGRTDAASFTEQLTLSGALCWIDPATDEVRGCWVNT